MHRKIKLKGTEDTPSVVLDRQNEILLFSGRSLPENVNDFYEPIFTWFNDYAKNPLEETKVHFKLEYFSTATSKLLYDLMIKLEDLKYEGNNVKIIWHYPDQDEDIHQAGIEFSEMVDLEFEFESYEEDEAEEDSEAEEE